MTSLFSRRKFVTISAVAAGSALFPFGTSHGAAAASLIEWQGMSLGGIATIRLHHPNRAAGERLLERVVAEARRLETIFSLYQPEFRSLRTQPARRAGLTAFEAQVHF